MVSRQLLLRCNLSASFGMHAARTDHQEIASPSGREFSHAPVRQSLFITVTLACTGMDKDLKPLTTTRGQELNEILTRLPATTAY